MSTQSKLTDHLKEMSRDQLNVVARKLKVKGYRKRNKKELIEYLLAEYPNDLASELNVTWWGLHHNHVYGVATLVSLVVPAIGFLIAWLFQDAHKFECCVESTHALVDRANTVFDGSDIDSWKTISSNEISTFVVRIANNSNEPVTVKRGTIVVDNFLDPLDEKTAIRQAAARSLMDHSDHHVATLGKLTSGESGLFPVNITIPAKSPVEIPVWVRLLDKDRFSVTFLDAKIRFYSSGGDWIETPMLRMEIHEETEDFALNDFTVH